MKIEIDGNNNVHIVSRDLDYIAIHNLAPDMVQRLQTANLNPDKLAQAIASARAMDNTTTVFANMNTLLANIRNGVILHELE